MSARFGRIPLDRITTEWEDGHPINPRLLASELAALLRTLAPVDHPILETYASTILSGAPPGQAVITHGALAKFFDSASLGKPAETITTSAGPVPAAAVLIWRQWLHTLAEEAAKRAALVAGFAIPANDTASLAAVSNSTPVAHQADPPPPSGSEPGYLKMRQAQQRREGERSAAEQLDAERIARQRAERSEAEKDAIILALRAQLQIAREEAESERRARIESDRARADLAEQLREHAGIIEFMNPENALSPVEGRRLVVIWCELTENGTVDASTDSGIGVGTLARDWWREHVGEPSDTEVKRLRWALTWPARKGGGVVAKRPRKKG